MKRPCLTRRQLSTNPRFSACWHGKLTLGVILAIYSFIPVLGQAVDIIKVDVGLVTVNVAVKDVKGRMMSGLKSDDFLITDENRPVIPEFFDGGGPASIVFVVDVSSSMKGRKWSSLMNGMKEFLKKAPEGNDYTLVSFADSAHLIAQSVNRAELSSCLSGLRPGGGTALFDGVLMGLEALRGTPKHRRALVLISDGEDNVSKRSFSEVKEEAIAQRTTIYSVGIVLQRDCVKRFPEACNARNTIRQLSDSTGGLTWFPDSQELPDVLSEINRDVAGQYSLSYYAPDHRPGWRSVDVTLVSVPRHSVRYQQRYLVR